MSKAALALLLCSLVAPVAVAGDMPSIAVLDFRAKSGITQDIVDSLADLVASAIQNTGKHKVIGKSDIQSMLGFEQVKDKLGCDDASCLAEIGGALGIDYILAGNIAKLGETFLLNLRLIDPKKTEVVSRASRKVTGGEAGLIDAVPQAVAELLGESAASAAEIGETRAQHRPVVAAAPQRTPAPRQDLVTVDIECNYEGAEIFIDGQVVGKAPLRRNVTRGKHSFTATGPHHKPTEMTKEITAPATIKITIREDTKKYAKYLRTKTEWFSGYLAGGNYGGGGGGSLFTVRWEYFFWEILRAIAVGGGPLQIKSGEDGLEAAVIAVGGTAFGLQFGLTDDGRHELRFSTGVLAGFMSGANGYDYDGTNERKIESISFGPIIPIDCYYVWHYIPYFALQLGVNLSIPTLETCPSAYDDDDVCKMPHPAFNVFLGFRI